jgi:hypothetical protein
MRLTPLSFRKPCLFYNLYAVKERNRPTPNRRDHDEPLAPQGPSAQRFRAENTPGEADEKDALRVRQELKSEPRGSVFRQALDTGNRATNLKGGKAPGSRVVRIPGYRSQSGTGKAKETMHPGTVLRKGSGRRQPVNQTQTPPAGASCGCSVRAPLPLREGGFSFTGGSSRTRWRSDSNGSLHPQGLNGLTLASPLPARHPDGSALPVRGSHYPCVHTRIVPQILQALLLAVAGGLCLPLVYNMGGYV